MPRRTGRKYTNKEKRRELAPIPEEVVPSDSQIVDAGTTTGSSSNVADIVSAFSGVDVEGAPNTEYKKKSPAPCMSPALHMKTKMIRLRIHYFTGDREAVREVLVSPLQIRRAEALGALYDLEVAAKGFAEVVVCHVTLSEDACRAVLDYMMYDPTHLLQDRFAALRNALGVRGGSLLTIDPGNRQGPFKGSRWTCVRFRPYSGEDAAITVQINNLLKDTWIPVHQADRQEPYVLSFVKLANVEDAIQAGFLAQEDQPLSPKDDPFFIYEWFACSKDEWADAIENGFTRCDRIWSASGMFYVRRRRL